MIIERHLSRIVEITDREGRTTRHHLSVATVTIDEGRIVDVTLEPFTREQPGIYYHDTPLRLTLSAPTNPPSSAQRHPPPPLARLFCSLVSFVPLACEWTARGATRRVRGRGGGGRRRGAC